MKLFRRGYYEKLLGVEKKTEQKERSVWELQQEIQKLQNEVESIQQSCPHPSYHVMYWMWRPGAMAPARVCDRCNGYIGEAGPDEAEKLNKESGLFQSFGVVDHD